MTDKLRGALAACARFAKREAVFTAALLLSGFTSDWRALIVGCNLGGLGTLIASMASLISYKQLAGAYPALRTRYLLHFTLLSLLLLGALYACAVLLDG